MKKLLILTQYFPPEIGAPQVRLLELGEELINLGWQVNALTALPNYPIGKIYEGYDHKGPIIEKISGINTVRVPLIPAKTGFLRRLICYFSFVYSSIKYGKKLCEKPDIIFVESPPLFIGFAARALIKHWHIPYVFNVSDLWPESVARIGTIKKGLVFKIVERYEISLYKSAEAITGQSDEIVESIKQRCPNKNVFLITNGVNTEYFDPRKANQEVRDFLGNKDEIIFIYAGLFGLAQGLDIIIEVAKRTRENKKIKYVLVGEGPLKEHLNEQVRINGLTNVRILPPQKREKMPPLIASVDAAIISLGVHLPGAVPSKIYEAMASAIPILLIADGEPAKRVTEAGAGISVRFDDIHGIEQAIYTLYNDKELRVKMGRAGRLAAETRYNRKKIAKKLDEILKDSLEEYNLRHKIATINKR